MSKCAKKDDVNSYILKGAFENALISLQKNNHKLNKAIALNMLIYCSQVCNKEELESTIIPEKLYSFLKLLLNYIGELKDEAVIKTYCNCFYFIVQFFIKKKSIKIILQMENMLCLDVVECIKNNSKENDYKFIYTTLHNFIVKYVDEKQKQVQQIVLLTELVVKMVVHIEPVEIVFKKFIFPYFQIYFNLNNCVSSLIKKEHNILTIVFSEFQTSDIFKYAINCLISISNIKSTNVYDKVNYITDIILKELKIIYKKKDNIFLLDILESFNKLVCDINSYPDEQELITILNTCQYNLEKYFTKSEDYQSVCNLLCTILINKSNCYRTIDINLWKEKVTINAQHSYILLLDCLQNIKKNMPFKCKSHDCGLKYDIPSILGLDMLKLIIFKNYSIDKSILRCFEYDLKLLSKLKQLKCENWCKYWKQIGTNLYNFGAQSSKCEDYAVKYYKLFLKYSIEFEGVNSSSIKTGIVITVIESICKMYFSQNDHRKVLIYSALGIYIYPKHMKTFFKFWVNSKFKDQTQLEELTLIDILNEYNGNFKYLISDLEHEKTLELLHQEIKHYKLLWPSTLGMIAACKRLQLEEDETSFAKTLVTTWLNKIPLQHSSVDQMVSNIMDILKNKIESMNFNSNIDIMLYYACLKFIKYKYSMENEKHAILKETQNEIFDKNSNLSDYEKTVYSYNSMKLENHFKIMDNLKEFLNFFDKFILLSEPVNVKIDILKSINIWDTLTSVAFEYRLHNYPIEMLQCWYINLQIAKILNDDFKILNAITFIIESSNTCSKDTEALMNQAINIINNLEKTHENLKLIATYYLNVSMYYLTVNDVENSIKYFNDGKTIQETILDPLLDIRIRYISTKYMMLPCDSDCIEHMNNNVTVNLILAIESLIDYKIKVTTNWSYVLSLMYEIAADLCSLYQSLKLPRELHCYSKLFTRSSIEHVLPLRFLYILYYLTHSDIINVKLDDCQSKLESFKNVLGCYKTKLTNANLELDVLCDNFEEINLECVGTSREYQTSLNSPKFVEKNLILPQCLQHSKNCHCFYCMSPQYQELVILNIYLEANVRILQGDLEVADKYFEAISRVYNNFYSKADFWQIKVNEKIPLNIIKFFKNKLNLIYCSVLYENRDNCIRLNNFNGASTLNQELTILLTKIKHLNRYLYNEVHTHQLDYICNINVTNVDNDDTPIEELQFTNNIVKTPENQVSTITFIKPSFTNCDVTPKRNIVKTIKFNISDTEDTSSPILLKSKNLAQEKTINLRTSTNINNVANARVTDDNNETFIVPGTPEPIKSSKALKAMTNVLTNKLKSSKKPLSDVNSSNNKTSICKNLFSKSSVDENEPPPVRTRQQRRKDTLTESHITNENKNTTKKTINTRRTRNARV